MSHEFVLRPRAAGSRARRADPAAGDHLQVAGAPEDVGGVRTGLKDGYFVTWGLDFYSLQRATSDGARLSITLSLALTFLVLFLFSENFVATLCAALTIFFILSCVLGVLVASAKNSKVGDKQGNKSDTGIKFSYIQGLGLCQKVGTYFDFIENNM